MTLPGLSTVATGTVVVHLALAAVVFRWRWQSRERPPVTEKLLRTPGERLRQRLDTLDERTCWLMLGTTLLAVAALAVGLSLLPGITSGSKEIAVVSASFVLFIAFAATGSWMILRTFNERRDLRRALQGERAVAESLASLVPAGYHVFHDVPTESRLSDDNVHHIVVGPGGIFSIQTQTHAGRKALPGRKPHEIIFDGDQLVYPWGQDTQGLVPARKKAEWLADWLYQVLGEHIPVSPVLTFPGWWVTLTTQQRDVGIYNPGQIAALIQQSSGGRLNDHQRALVIRQLENRCRDVEF